ncbi:PREDICTED: probable 3-hydroxyisobutyrate dehydrogenase, mitochondrial isoform X2 [Theobroma cacao]|uniref:3-hydroxyisobutyrate dehydrogenase n=1 Tax=Theobroma cacao TaxID=3641 RepID=A0AB32UYY5_THECC|nr:PREDICTED: probable 3-hydroxyisobutyrate dehydrogenase, mitochondrial isoform X2 [Theobroma cacao]
MAMRMRTYGHRLRALLSNSLSKVEHQSQQLLVSSSPFHSFPTRSFASSNLSSHFESVGFIGLGNMGSRMANNLLKAGYKVTVHDVNCNVMKIYSDMGVSTKQTPFEVAEASEVVITMLPSSSHVLEVYNGPNGLLHGGSLRTPRLLIDSSTIDPQTSRKLSVSVSNCTLKDTKDNWESPLMLDAPVSGGVVAAEAGTLTFMAAKICNNLAVAVSMLGVSEALALGQSLGITASTLTKIFNCSSARCWSSDSYNPVPGVMPGVPSSRNYSGGFASKLMAKDLNLAAASAEEVGVKSPLTFLAQNIYAEICENGHESEDFSCVFHHYYSGKGEPN